VFSFWFVSIIPYEFGPRIVMFALLAKYFISSSSFEFPISEKPAERIIADLTFFLWACCRICGTSFAGTAMTIRSSSYGISKMSL